MEGYCHSGFVLFRVLQFPWLSMTLGLAVTFENFQTFTCLSIFLSLNSSTETTWSPPKCAPFAPFNYFSLSYIILALSSAVTYLPNKTLIFHDFQEPKLKTKRLHSLTFQVFHDLHKPCKWVITVFIRRLLDFQCFDAAFVQGRRLFLKSLTTMTINLL